MTAIIKNKTELSSKNVSDLLLYADDKEKMLEILGPDNINKLTDTSVKNLLAHAFDKNEMINLIIKNSKGENKVFEFPYPFKATQTDKRIVLSYKNKEIVGNDQEILKIIKNYTKLKNSKLLDNEIVFLVGNIVK